MLRCFDNVPFKGNLRANLGHPPKLLLEVSLGKGLMGGVSTPLPEWGGLKEKINFFVNGTNVGFNTPPGVGRVESDIVGAGGSGQLQFQHPSRSGAG